MKAVELEYIWYPFLLPKYPLTERTFRFAYKYRFQYLAKQVHWGTPPLRNPTFSQFLHSGLTTLQPKQSIFGTQEALKSPYLILCISFFVWDCLCVFFQCCALFILLILHFLIFLSQHSTVEWCGELSLANYSVDDHSTSWQSTHKILSWPSERAFSKIGHLIWSYFTQVDFPKWFSSLDNIPFKAHSIIQKASPWKSCPYPQEHQTFLCSNTVTNSTLVSLTQNNR